VTQERHGVQALRESRGRLSFLAKSGQALLDASVDHHSILERVVDLVVPELADYAALREVTEDGSLQRMAVRHADPAKTELVRRLVSYQAADTPPSLAGVLQTGKSLLAAEIPPESIKAIAQDEEHLRLLTELDAASMMQVAIPARGKIVAVVSLIAAGSGRRFGPLDVLLVEDLARRAGLAIDNARLYESEHRALAEVDAARAEAEATRGSLALLLDASTVLNGSLEFEEGLSRLARFAASSVCDICLVDVLGPGGAPRRAAVEVADPEHQHLAEHLLRHCDVGPGSSSPSLRVMRTGVAELSQTVPPDLLCESSQGIGTGRMDGPQGFLSYLCVPLAARSRVLGALTLVTTDHSGRHYGDADLRLAEDLAQRAGLVLDNALLFEERSRIASILQQSLLPPELPEIPGIELAGRYRPALGEIGGDFYDVFALGRRRWLLAVGDVCGKGPEAAWLTSMVRYTLRAAAMQEVRPGRMLSMVNAAMLRQAPRFQFCTLACAVLAVREGTETLTLALGGHPRPLLLGAGGSVRQIGRAGDLLGVLEDPSFHDETTVLAAGDALAFFTDGALDASMLAGEDDAHLMATLASAAGQGAEEIATALEATVAQQRQDRAVDDLLLLVAKVQPLDP
jgi:serine phosphatase RsbU (regulator of sigma subunit)